MAACVSMEEVTLWAGYKSVDFFQWPRCCVGQFNAGAVIWKAGGLACNEAVSAAVARDVGFVQEPRV